ncbi:transposase [Flexivirga lutea]
MGAKRKSYTPKYRQEAARLVIDTDRTIAAVARDIGVGEALLGRWVAIERSRMDDPPEAIGPCPRFLDTGLVMPRQAG